MLNKLVRENFRVNRLKTAIHVSALGLEVSMLIVAVGIQRGIGLNPNPITISFAYLVMAALWFLTIVALCFDVVERRAALLERTQELAILKMLGASGWYVGNILAQETLLVLIPGTIAGIAIALCSKVLIANTLAKFLFVTNVYSWWFVAPIIVGGSDLAAALLTMRKISSGDLVNALTYDD